MQNEKESYEKKIKIYLENKLYYACDSYGAMYQ